MRDRTFSQPVHVMPVMMTALLIVLSAAVMFTAAAQSPPPSISCGQITLDIISSTVEVTVIVDSGTAAIDKVRMEMLFDNAVLSNPTLSLGTDFDTVFSTATETASMVATLGRSSNMGTATGQLQFAIVTFDWTGGLPNDINFVDGNMDETGSLQYVADDVILLNGGSCFTQAVPTPETLTPTPEPSPEPTHTPQVTLPPPAAVPDDGDLFEQDDECIDATELTTNSLDQVHTFHDIGDTDWIRFDAVADVPYVLTIQTPLTSTANLIIEIYDDCDNFRITEKMGSLFERPVRLSFLPTYTGTYYVRFFNRHTDLFGEDSTYSISVREAQTSNETGSLIIVAGEESNNASLQNNIYDVTNTIYRTYVNGGYEQSRVHYLANDSTLDPFDTGASYVDGLSTIRNLEDAILSWEWDHTDDENPLTIYMVGYGEEDKFFLNRQADEFVTSEQLDSWLDTLKSSFPEIKINIIIDADYSGSFIDLPNSLSQDNRAIFTSTKRDELGSTFTFDKAFSNTFISFIGNGYTLNEAFYYASESVQYLNASSQTPQLDTNGNAVANEPDDRSETLTQWLQEPDWTTWYPCGVPSSYAFLEGIITEFNTPAQEIEVILLGENEVLCARTVTNDNGFYEFTVHPDQSYTLLYIIPSVGSSIVADFREGVTGIVSINSNGVTVAYAEVFGIAPEQKFINDVSYGTPSTALSVSILGHNTLNNVYMTQLIALTLFISVLSITIIFRRQRHLNSYMTRQ